MKMYNNPIIEIKAFEDENIVTTSTAEQWQQTYEGQGATVKNISFNDLKDNIQLIF